MYLLLTLGAATRAAAATKSTGLIRDRVVAA